MIFMKIDREIQNPSILMVSVNFNQSDRLELFVRAPHSKAQPCTRRTPSTMPFISQRFPPSNSPSYPPSKANLNIVYHDIAEIAVNSARAVRISRDGNQDWSAWLAIGLHITWRGGLRSTPRFRKTWEIVKLHDFSLIFHEDRSI